LEEKRTEMIRNRMERMRKRMGGIIRTRMTRIYFWGRKRTGGRGCGRGRAVHEPPLREEAGDMAIDHEWRELLRLRGYFSVMTIAYDIYHLTWV